MTNIKKIAARALLASAGAVFYCANAWAAIPIQHWAQPSGAQVWLVESPSIPMLDVQIDFDAGSRRDPASQAGLASVTALMAGKGVAALQEAGWLPVSLYAGPRFDLLGIYPTLQSIGAQILALAVLWAGFAWNRHQARQAAPLSKDTAA